MTRIQHDVRFVALPTQICAIMPFLQNRGENNIIIPELGKLYARVLSFVLIVSSGLFCVDVLLNTRNYKIMKPKYDDTEEMNQTIEILCCIVSYTMIVISCAYNGRKHCRTYKDMTKIDEFLEANGYEGAYKAPILGFFLALLACVVFGMGFFYINIRSDLPWFRQCVLLISYALQMLFSTTFALYFRIFLKNISRRIEFVNKKLKQFVENDGKENWRELSILVEMFCKFRYIADNMNAVTGVALLFYMGYAFYAVTNQSYQAFSILTTHVEFINKYDTMGLSVSWVTAEVTILTIICNSCDAVKSAANTTSQILARVYGKSKEYQNVIDKFLTKSIKQEVEFTAYGFFVIDNSTLFKIFSAVTTYLVILIQFKQLEDSKKEDMQNIGMKN